MLVGSTDKNTTEDTWYYILEDRRRYVDLWTYGIWHKDTVQFNIANSIWVLNVTVKRQSKTGLIR